MPKNFWLIKQEPEAYSWDDFVKEGQTTWTGVRNYQARNNLRGMKKGELVLFYHSVSAREIVGIAKVHREAFPDPTAKEGDWSSVEFIPDHPLTRSISLDEVKKDPLLREMALVKNSRLSVQPVTPAQFKKVLSLGAPA